MPDTRKGRAKQKPLATLDNKGEDSDSNGEASGHSTPTGAMLREMSDAILKAINDRFDQFEIKFTSLQSSQNALTVRMDSMDEIAGEHDTRLTLMEKNISKIQRENTLLQAKINDLEGRSRRNNIKIVGIPEGEEKGKPTEFISALIPKLLGEAHFQKPLLIDRAHRTQQPKPTEGARPRTLIARVHFFHEKDMIIRLGRQQTLVYNGRRVFIFPDYTAEVMEQRRGFRDVMQTLREMEVKYSLRFPAKLQLQHNGQLKVFTSPGEAKKFVEGHLRSNAGNEQTG